MLLGNGQISDLAFNVNDNRLTPNETEILKKVIFHPSLKSKMEQIIAENGIQPGHYRNVVTQSDKEVLSENVCYYFKIKNMTVSRADSLLEAYFKVIVPRTRPNPTQWILSFTNLNTGYSSHAQSHLFEFNIRLE